MSTNKPHKLKLPKDYRLPRDSEEADHQMEALHKLSLKDADSEECNFTVGDVLVAAKNNRIDDIRKCNVRQKYEPFLKEQAELQKRELNSELNLIQIETIKKKSHTFVKYICKMTDARVKALAFSMARNVARDKKVDLSFVVDLIRQVQTETQLEKRKVDVFCQAFKFQIKKDTGKRGKNLEPLDKKTISEASAARKKLKAAFLLGGSLSILCVFAWSFAPKILALLPKVTPLLIATASSM